MFLLLFSLMPIMNGCIPTQEVEPITTTTTTTTEDPTTTTVPYPCSACTPIYNTGCMGYGVPSPTNWCAIGEDIPVTYTIGINDYGSTACQTTLQCPSGTIAYFDQSGTEVEGNDGGTDSYSISCEEEGNYVGMWMTQIEAFPQPINLVTCRNA
ncbi:C6 domain-containing protein [Caenorhabditis elegans]|uniref:C6 domain-containing protein n=1 Tax=Caenorhabditis elegans TaxID=6239 RepID=A9Z1L4_CAEEL|nr:C6 domain-containing protein [Caenorhabditis elegans]CCD63059.2 C6 domain-containing protein [Caenorhabditis elegans]|eukprot:NP_001122577.2 Uncharacterized protein CELE_C04G6.13 [Caenorhabditis elegans]